MKTNILFLMLATAILIVACGTSKKTSNLINNDALSVLKPKVSSPAATKVETDRNENAVKVKKNKEEKAAKAKKEKGKKVKKKDVEVIEELVEIEANEKMSKKEIKAAKKRALEAIEEIKDATVEVDENVSTQKSEVIKETKEMTAAPTEEGMAEIEKPATELSTLETETLEIDQEKVIDEEEVIAAPIESANKKQQKTEMNLAGKYMWVKRICCGRMRVETTPKDGEELYMEMTKDGKVLYSGNSQKKVANTTYEMKANTMSFPDRKMLKIEGKIDALVRFRGDTLVIDRGYIDLDKNYWIKVKE